jgi:arabinogalactan oligomer/maltooligosaccharide transport system substrate-binding protein
MKKQLLTLAAATLATVSLVSCGGKVDDTVEAIATTKINVWATASEQAVVEEVIKNWNAAQPTDETKFNIEFTAVSEADCGTTLAKDPQVKGAPALFLCADDQISNLASLNIIAEIKGERKEKIVNRTTEVAVAGATMGGKLYGYPVTSDNGYFLWYDSSKLPSEKLGSLEDILAHAKSTGKQVLMDVPNGWYANSFIMSPDACGTTSLKWKVDANGNKVYETSWDNATGVKVSSYIQSLLTPYYKDGTLIVGGNEVIAAGFNDGTLMAAVSGTWMENDIKAAIGSNTAATKLPSYHIGGKAYQMASFSGSKVYCLNKTRPVEEQKTAAALAELLTTKESQLVRFEKRSSLPCHIEAAKDPRYTEHVTIGGKALLEQNAYACVQAQTAEDRYWDIGKAIGQAYIDGILKDADENTLTWEQFLKAQMETLRKPLA